MTDALDERKQRKAKQPDFTRDDYGKKDRVNDSWRKPSGHHNKIRLNKRGHPAPVNTGYGTATVVKGLHPSGLEPVRVCNVDDIKELDEGEGAIIASSVGDRKRVAMIDAAAEADVEILNIDSAEYKENVEEKMEQRRETETDEEQEDTSEEEKEEERKDPEEQQEELEEQKEKVLTKK